MADQFFTGGTVVTNAKAIANTQDDPIYQSERNGLFSYQIPVPVGSYEVVVHLAET